MRSPGPTGQAPAEGGFTLLELLVAMLMTLIVSGAIFGLMTVGQNSFRREPEVAERQQNIRVAMDMIQRDIAGAGAGMGHFVQAFTDTDQLGPLNNSGPAAFPAVIEPAAGAGENTDALEILSNDGLCPQLPVDKDRPGGGPVTGSDIWTLGAIPSCYPEDGFYVIEYQGVTRIGVGFNIHAGDFSVNFPPGQQLPPPYEAPQPPLDAPPLGVPTALGTVHVVRYEIEPDPADGTPALWRSLLGGRDLASQTYVPPPGGDWQLVARGIEDLQVEYRNGNNVWQDNAGVVSCLVPNNCTLAEYNTIVQEVRVTLSARALAPRLAGETTSAQGTAIRGQLTSVSTPRAALLALQESKLDPLPWQ